MLLDDLLEDFGCAEAIPYPFRIDQSDRSLDADSQAIDLAAINQRFRTDQCQLFEPALQKFP